MDHYLVLGLPTGEEGSRLGEREITKAFKSKALQTHPDKRPHTEAEQALKQFQKLKYSYEILLDPSKRQAFDALILMQVPEPPAEKRGRKRPPMSNEEPKPPTEKRARKRPRMSNKEPNPPAEKRGIKRPPMSNEEPKPPAEKRARKQSSMSYEELLAFRVDVPFYEACARKWRAAGNHRLADSYQTSADIGKTLVM